MLARMGYGVFIFYAVFDTIAAFVCWFMFKETAKAELEDVVINGLAVSRFGQEEELGNMAADDVKNIDKGQG